MGHITKKIKAGIREFFISLFAQVRSSPLGPADDRGSETYPSALRIRVAQTKEELDSAFRLLHDCYVKEGFMKAHPSGLRVTKYHALPSTTTLIATMGPKVVGTVTLIRSAGFGTPVEKNFDLTRLKESGARIVEVASLAIHPSYSGERGDILFPLFKAVYEYSVRSFGAEYLTIEVTPRRMPFFETILLFEKLNPLDRLWKKTVGGVFKLNQMRTNFGLVYESRAREQNLHHFFVDLKLKNIELPERPFHKISDPVLTPDLLDHFFRGKTETFEKLTEYEKQVLHDFYDDPEYQSVLPRPDRSVPSLTRKEKRFDVHIASRVVIPQKDSVLAKIRNVSPMGLLIDADRSLREGERYVIQMAVSDELQAEVEGVVVRNEIKRRYGLRLVKASGEWNQMLEYLERDLRRTRPAVH